jgi:hypothetical protein
MGISSNLRECRILVSFKPYGFETIDAQRRRELEASTFNVPRSVY